MRRPALAAWLLAAAALGALPLLLAQEEEDLTAGAKAMQGVFNQAREKIDNLDFAGAVRDLTTLIEPRRAARPADLSAEEGRLLAAAYDLRARAHFNLGNVKGAEADFAALLRLDTAYVIDRQTLSPKVVDLFDKVRARVAGLLAIQVEPPNARLTVDGDPVERDATGTVALLAGRRVLRIESPGHDPHEEILMVLAGAEVRKSLRLRPNRRTLQFVTVPAEVQVSVDGSPVGATRGPATPDVEALAAQFGFDARQASAPFLAPLVTPGDHRVTFEKPCYQTQTLNLKVTLDEANAPLRFAPVLMQEARTELRITSVPSGADVLVDGERKGTTPLTVPSLCGGERDIQVIKAEAGSWNERIRLTPGQVNVVEARLRPTLLYAGTFRLDEWGRAVWSDEDRPLLDALNKGLKTLNMVRSQDALQAVRGAIIKWMITEPDEVRAGTLVPPAVLQEAASRAGADLVLAGLTLANDPEKGWTLALYSVLHAAPDIAPLRLDRPDGARLFVERLDAAPPPAEPWWGVGLADTLVGAAGAEAEAPIVVRVLPGSPAAKAGLRVGDRVASVGNRKVQNVRDLKQTIAAELARPGGVRPTLVLAVDDASGTRTVRLAPVDAPAVLPLTEGALLYNRALAEFRLRSRAASDEVERGVALLNLGIAFMHFRAYERAAAEGFARARLPQGAGISDGTLQFYRGLCALRSGDPAGARAALEAAAASPGATLDSADGPSAAAAAARMLLALR